MEPSRRAADLLAFLRDYAGRINSVVMDERRCVPPYVALDFGRAGVFGLSVSRDLGGLGLDFSTLMKVLEQLSAIDLTLATWAGIHNTLGVRPIDRFAPAPLRDELVPLLASGRVLAGLAMTEPSAGSNPRRMESMAHRDGAGYRLRGDKLWIGNAGWAGVLNVFARRPPKEGGGMNAFAVSLPTQGVRIGREALTMGMRAIVQNEVHLEDAFVGDERVLGKPGDGFAVAEDAFSFARLAIGANAVGGLKRAAQLSLRYVTRRQISTGRSLDNNVTRTSMSWLACAALSLEELVRAAAEETDRSGVVPAFLAAACKVAGSELLGRGIDLAIQMLGGRGYIETNVLPQLSRDARVLRIFEGPTETMEAYLGSAWAHGAMTLPSLFDGQLRAPETLAAVSAALDRCKEACPKKEDAAELRSVAGHVLVAAAISGAAEQADARASTPLSKSAMTWARGELANAESAGLARLREPVMLAPAAIEEIVHGYVRDIGDVNHAGPVADYALDPLLAPLPPSAG